MSCTSIPFPQRAQLIDKGNSFIKKDPQYNRKHKFVGIIVAKYNGISESQVTFTHIYRTIGICSPMPVNGGNKVQRWTDALYVRQDQSWAVNPTSVQFKYQNS